MNGIEPEKGLTDYPYLAVFSCKRVAIICWDMEETFG